MNSPVTSARHGTVHRGHAFTVRRTTFAAGPDVGAPAAIVASFASAVDTPFPRAVIRYFTSFVSPSRATSLARASLSATSTHVSSSHGCVPPTTTLPRNELIGYVEPHSSLSAAAEASLTSSSGAKSMKRRPWPLKRSAYSGSRFALSMSGKIGG
eukprot:848081-Pleurochrysis_carterae.AAC.2